MIVYWSSDLDFSKNVLKELQSKRTSNSNPANFLSCPAVRDGWKNVWEFGLSKDLKVKYDADNVEELNDGLVVMNRKPHLRSTNIFKICLASTFFSEMPLKMKVTAPYFHNVKYQENGTFVGGVYDIGKWYRQVQCEIITWQESGVIDFRAGDPLFYAEFLTDEKIELVRYQNTHLLNSLMDNLINSPFQTPSNFQGNLESRYEAFERSDYRKAILEEIQANLLPL